jgi:hypothetical protein
MVLSVFRNYDRDFSAQGSELRLFQKGAPPPASSRARPRVLPNPTRSPPVLDKRFKVRRGGPFTAM